MGLCKRTGFLGVKRRENPVRLHILPSALPPKGEASHYGANNFLNLTALPLEPHLRIHLTGHAADGFGVVDAGA